MVSDNQHIYAQWKIQFSLFLSSRIKIPGSEVIPVPLFNVLDGKTTSDYIARVEPSAVGGKKLAEYLLDVIDNPSITGSRASVTPPSSSLMTDRH